MKVKKIPEFENIWYYLSVVLTLGGTFTLKTIIRRAITQALNDKE